MLRDHQQQPPAWIQKAWLFSLTAYPAVAVSPAGGGPSSRVGLPPHNRRPYGRYTCNGACGGVPSATFFSILSFSDILKKIYLLSRRDPFTKLNTYPRMILFYTQYTRLSSIGNVAVFGVLRNRFCWNF